jgi:predicted anti-sigma-YlaC factor YlaD
MTSPCRFLIVALVASLVLSSCAVLGAASKLGTVLSSEEDPELAAAALPSFIMASEALHEADPKDQGKAVATASLYVMYANAFVQGPAAALPDEKFEERQAAFERAGALYRRAFRILSGALDARAAGLVEAAVDGSPKCATALARLGKADVPLLYWSAASILAGFGLNPLDFKSAHYLGAAPRFLERAAALDPGWNKGAIYGIYLSYYAGMPDYLGGDMTKAEEAYAKALAYSKGGSASLFVAYASSICLPKGDYAGYKAALEKALAIDPDKAPDARLETVIAQKNARRLIKEGDTYFMSAQQGETP